jgi:hypothetical protein
MQTRSLPELVRMADRLTGAYSNIVGDLFQVAAPVLQATMAGRRRKFNSTS